MSSADDEIRKDLTTNGVLRAAINLGNPVLAQGTPSAPAGVPADSGLTTPADVDAEGVRIGVNEGSAYDLFLSRTLQRASLVRGGDGISLLREQGLEAAAGIRQVIADFAVEELKAGGFIGDALRRSGQDSGLVA